MILTSNFSVTVQLNRFVLTRFLKRFAKFVKPFPRLSTLPSLSIPRLAYICCMLYRRFNNRSCFSRCVGNLTCDVFVSSFSYHKPMVSVMYKARDEGALEIDQINCYT